MMWMVRRGISESFCDALSSGKGVLANTVPSSSDYLMGSDLDYSHPEVEEDVLNWGKWLAKEIPLKGIRFDAIKHYSEDFLRKFVKQIGRASCRERV